jgi:hypothetical protein
MAAAEDSDQEEWVEEQLATEPGNIPGTSPQKKKRQFYYYALAFEVDLKYKDDVVFFAFSQPYPYT